MVMSYTIKPGTKTAIVSLVMCFICASDLYVGGYMLNVKEIIETLKTCRMAIKLIHPNLNPDEPCIAYEASQEALILIEKLERLQQGEEDVLDRWSKEADSNKPWKNVSYS